MPPESDLNTKLQHLPDSPGVYLWKSPDGTVLYVGKAKNLRSRVRNYLALDAIEGSVKTAALMRQAADIETIVVPSEESALMLESNLIKEHKPRFNITLRDDKSYPYIKITITEAFPRVFVTRRVLEDGSLYFGPYTDVGAMRRSLNLVKRVFTVRSCNYDMPRDVPERPCLDYHIGRCLAPCAGFQSQQSYGSMISEVVAFLSGKGDEAVKRVSEMMNRAAESLEYERAAELRDAVRALEKMEEPSVVVRLDGGDCDVLGFARDGDDACVAMLSVRGGRLLARDHRFLEHVEGEPDEEILAAYLTGDYLKRPNRASELIVPFDPAGSDLIVKALQPARVIVPHRGPRRELADLAEQNSRHLLEEFRLAAMEIDERAADPLYELARALEMKRIPRSIVCFDISTSHGVDTVGSCVWFENGRPLRSEYRKFRIKTVEGTDDFAAMSEVVTRYFERRVNESRHLPDLVVIDGGKGQLGAALAALRALNVENLTVVGLAKREEEVFMAGVSEPLHLPRRSSALRLLQRIRDEAHRFAISYNRRRRLRRTVTSELLRIPGVGPARRTALLRAFGSLDAVRSASEEAIAAVPGFSLASAKRILHSLQETDPTNPKTNSN